MGRAASVVSPRSSKTAGIHDYRRRQQAKPQSRHSAKIRKSPTTRRRLAKHGSKSRPIVLDDDDDHDDDSESEGEEVAAGKRTTLTQEEATSLTQRREGEFSSSVSHDVDILLRSGDKRATNPASLRGERQALSAKPALSPTPPTFAKVVGLGASSKQTKLPFSARLRSLSIADDHRPTSRRQHSIAPKREGDVEVKDEGWLNIGYFSNEEHGTDLEEREHARTKRSRQKNTRSGKSSKRERVQSSFRKRSTMSQRSPKNKHHYSGICKKKSSKQVKSRYIPARESDMDWLAPETVSHCDSGDSYEPSESDPETDDEMAVDTDDCSIEPQSDDGSSDGSDAVTDLSEASV